jgi:hypothetical protein
MQCVLDSPKKISAPGKNCLFLGMLPEGAAWVRDQNVIVADHEGLVLSDWALCQNQEALSQFVFLRQSCYCRETSRLVCLVVEMALNGDPVQSQTDRLLMVESGSGRARLGQTFPEGTTLSSDGTQFAWMKRKGIRSPDGLFVLTTKVWRGILDTTRGTFEVTSSVDLGSTFWSDLEIWNDGRVWVSGFETVKLWDLDQNLKCCGSSVQTGCLAARWVRQGWIPRSGGRFEEELTLYEAVWQRLADLNDPGKRIVTRRRMGETQVNRVWSLSSDPKLDWLMDSLRDLGFDCPWQHEHFEYSRFDFADESVLVMIKITLQDFRSVIIHRARDSLQNLCLANFVSSLPLEEKLFLAEWNAVLPDWQSRRVARGFYDYRLRTESFCSIDPTDD